MHESDFICAYIEFIRAFAAKNNASMSKRKKIAKQIAQKSSNPRAVNK
jgi:hypothetical protein